MSSAPALLDRLAAEPMLDHTRDWAAVNSGTRNLAGLKAMASALADALSVLPGNVSLIEPETASSVSADGKVAMIAHGRHLVVKVRPDAPVRMLFTGHMDTGYPADHPFQNQQFLDANTLNGPGVADMKGGLALLLAALKAVEASPLAARVGYDVMINSDEETGSFSSAALAAAQTAIDDAIATVARDRDVKIDVHGSFNRPPKPVDAGAAKLFALVKQAGADLGLDVGWKATGGVCDGNNIAAAGVPVVDTMGARGGAIHSPDEFLLVDSLVERAALSALTVLKIAEKGGL